MKAENNQNLWIGIFSGSSDKDGGYLTGIREQNRYTFLPFFLEKWEFNGHLCGNPMSVIWTSLAVQSLINIENDRVPIFNCYNTVNSKWHNWNLHPDHAD